MPDNEADKAPDREEQMRVLIGQNIKHLRQDRKLSQEDLAEQLGTSNKHISEAERGTTGLSYDMLVRLGEVLKVPPFEFLRPTFNEIGASGFALSPDDIEKIDHVIQLLERLKRAGARATTPK